MCMVKLMEHQENALKQLTNGKILHGGVGSGKSLTAMHYYIQNESPKDIYVITTVKKRDELDWEEEAAKVGITGKPGATVGGLLIVDSWNNIKKYTEVEDAFFIFDEQRLVGSGAWVKAFYKIAKNNNWILLTATPGDNWMDYVPVLVANGLYKNKTQFCREHVVFAPYSRYPKVQKYINTDILEKYRSMLLVEMPYVKHTERHLEYVKTAYDFELVRRAQKDRWHVYEDRPIEDVAELFRVVRQIGSTDPSRLQALCELMDVHPRIIVFYNFNYERDILRSLGNVIEVAEYNGEVKDPVPSGDRWLYIVQYIAGAEGWNCTATDAMVFWSLTYSWKQFEQAQGRIDRLNTKYKHLFYYALFAPTFVERHVKAALETKQNFNERVFYDQYPDLIKI